MFTNSWTTRCVRAGWLRTAAAALSFLVLVACGGSAPSAPTIGQFSAERTDYFVGERARLTAVFSGGTGRIEPGIGAVTSGITLDTPVLDSGVTYRLIVESANAPAASRELALPVKFRDRYATLDAPFQSARHAAVTTGDGSVLIIGGSRGSGALSHAIDRFDPATRRFARIGGLLGGRESHRATRLDDGRILVTGGVIGLAGAPTAELIDERTGDTQAAAPMKVQRIYHAATQLADGRVLLTGGNAIGAGQEITDTAEVFDPRTYQFRLLAARMANPRTAHTATLLADGRVLIVGGYSTVNAPAYRLAEVFDPRTESFATLVAAAETVRAQHGAHRLRDGSVLIVGGEAPIAAGTGYDAIATVMRFVPATGKVENAPALSVPRSLVASVLLPDDRVLMIGGQAAGGRFLAGGEAYDARLGGFSLGAATPRAWHTATRLADGRVLIVGGEDPEGRFVTSTLLYE